MVPDVRQFLLASAGHKAVYVPPPEAVYAGYLIPLVLGVPWGSFSGFTNLAAHVHFLVLSWGVPPLYPPAYSRLFLLETGI